MGLACVGDPNDPWDWSGITHNIYVELQRLGHDPVWIDARASGPVFGRVPRLVAGPQLLAARRLKTGERPVEVAYRLGAASATNATTTGLVATTRRHRARAPRDLIQLRGDFVPARSTRTVIYEDIIVPQVAEHRWWSFASPVPPRLTARRIANQRRAHRRAVASCAMSEWVGAAICREYGISRRRVHVVGLGARAIVEDPPRSWESPRFLWIGLDWRRKGGEQVVRAFQQVRVQHPEAELHMVGTHPKLDQEGVFGYGRLDRRVDRDRAILIGLLARATCFVMPSVLEPAGIVHAEAGLAGVPSIGTTVGGPATIVGAGGVLVDPGDLGQLVDAMLDLSHPERARSLGTLALAHSRQFTWPKVAERLVRALDPQLADRLGYGQFLA